MEEQLMEGVSSAAGATSADPSEECGHAEVRGGSEFNVEDEFGPVAENSSGLEEETGAPALEDSRDVTVEPAELQTAGEEPEDAVGEDGTTEGDETLSRAFEEQEVPDVEPPTAEHLSYDDSIKYTDMESKEEEEPLVLNPSTEDCESLVKEASTGSLKEEEHHLEINGKGQLQLLRELQAEREKLIQKNSQLQNIIAEYLCKKSGEEPHPSREGPVSNMEEHYQKSLAAIEGLKRQHHHYSQLHQQHVEKLHLSQEKLDHVEQEWRTFMTKRREVALPILTLKLGKTAALAKVEQLQEAEQQREDELIALRRKNIRMKIEAQKLEAALRVKNELPEDRHLIEQLKIENETYKEKLEELSEEHLKVKKKITKNVEILTHVKETLDFLQEENRTKRVQLVQLDAELTSRQEVLREMKQERDRLRADNQHLQQRCGLLGKNRLLRDFEEKVDTCDSLNKQLTALQRRHAELTLRCAEVKKKVERSRTLSH